MQKPDNYKDYIGFAILISFIAALNAVVGHELIHHRESYNKILGCYACAKLMKCDFLDEHIKGHHKTVATVEDPATSLKNETVYSFIVRSFWGSKVNVWGYEAKKIRAKYGEDANIF